MTDLTMADRLLKLWNSISLFTIIFPFTLFLLIGIVRRDDNWWGDWDLGDRENKGPVLVIFVFICCLIFFVGIVSLGRTILSGQTFFNSTQEKKSCFKRIAREYCEERNLGFLIGLLVAFGIFSFLFFILSLGLLVDFDQPGLEALSKFSTFIPLTFLLWAIFSLLFFLRLTKGIDDSDEEVNGYRRDENDDNRTAQKKFGLFSKSKSSRKGSGNVSVV